MDIKKRVNEAIEESKNVNQDAVLQSRKDFALVHFVVGQHDTEPMQWHQCVLELCAKRDSLKVAILEMKRLERKIKRVRKEKPLDYDIDLELMEIERQKSEQSMLAMVRELETLQKIHDQFPEFTHEQIQDAQIVYWQQRLFRQAENDLLSTGRVSGGNIEAIRQAGLIENFKQYQIEEKQKHALGLETTYCQIHT